ncbi:hypothetical protein IDJ77_03735 [Mucilaginibacter sp. ZT4R22]|uniref:Uncharacterized protein n=1 Tax=Mucilaginibacter pankratovii TaxID=2772110 RepID=A0ABR7WKR1_9SPHI|nr:hypothetical protein [Mucilaginibacter pankratovii]MBD1362911.1 hypothetical protein [Mucilaginibacter pankratovii]
MTKYILDSQSGDFYVDAAITIHGHYHRRNERDMTVRELFLRALKSRRKTRTDYVLKHLGIAAKHLEQFEIDVPDAYNQLLKTVMGFEPAAIGSLWKYPVYWDFERFVHIYLRHYKEFFIKASGKGQGTSFQYNYGDIRRIIKIVLDMHKDDIQASLSAGKPYNKYDNQGAYYNGNYYTFRIAEDGKLMQFHPQEQ